MTRCSRPVWICFSRATTSSRALARWQSGTPQSRWCPCTHLPPSSFLAWCTCPQGCRRGRGPGGPCPRSFLTSERAWKHPWGFKTSPDNTHVNFIIVKQALFFFIIRGVFSLHATNKVFLKSAFHQLRYPGNAFGLNVFTTATRRRNRLSCFLLHKQQHFDMECRKVTVLQCDSNYRLTAPTPESR